MAKSPHLQFASLTDTFWISCWSIWKLTSIPLPMKSLDSTKMVVSVGFVNSRIFDLGFYWHSWLSLVAGGSFFNAPFESHSLEFPLLYALSHIQYYMSHVNDAFVKEEKLQGFAKKRLRQTSILPVQGQVAIQSVATPSCLEEGEFFKWKRTLTVVDVIINSLSPKIIPGHLLWINHD